MQTGKGSAAYQEFTEMPYLQFLEEIMSYAAIGRHALYYAKCTYEGLHVLTLDCDSEGAVLVASKYLNEIAKLKFEIVESTHNKFWIFVDFASKDPQEVMMLLSSIPLVDPKYVKFAVQLNQLMIRISPKLSENRTLIFPKFNENPNLTGVPALFYKLLREHYQVLESLITMPYTMANANRDHLLFDIFSDPGIF